MSDFPTEPMPPEAPLEMLGRYRVLRLLGQGGMGEVYLAEDTLLHRRVALKRVLDTGPASHLGRDRMLREARRASRVLDPRVASVYDVFDTDKGVVLVMEYVEGETIRERLQGPMALDAFWNLALQCTEAIEAAHRHGVLHRDLKPDNIMITPSGGVKILDFGVARRIVSDNGVTPETLDTIDAHAAGTPAYMAPEALLGGLVDERSDIYSLGVFFYETLAGVRPFNGGSLAATLHQILSGTYTPLRDVNPAVPEELARVIERTMAKEPADRYGSARDLRDALGAVRDDAPAPAPRRARAPLRRTAVGIGAVLVLAAAALALVRFVPRMGAVPLPVNRDMAVLPVIMPEDLADYARGLTDMITSRLDRRASSRLDVIPLGDLLAEKATTPAECRARLGANLVLRTTLLPEGQGFKGVQEVLTTSPERVIRSREFTVSDSPFDQVDRLMTGALTLLEIPSDPAPAADPRDAFGTGGAGSMKFYLEGTGRLRTADNADALTAALESLQRAVDSDPQFALAHVSAGWVHYRRFRTLGTPSLPEAKEAAERAIGLDSLCAEAYQLLGSVSYRQGEPDRATQALERSVALDPTNDAAYFELGRVYGRSGNQEAEEAVYRRAIDAKPHSSRRPDNLATLLYRRGRFEEARAAFGAMVNLSPEYYRGYALLGALDVQEGRYEDAKRNLDRSIALHPTEAALSNLGTAYFNLRDFDRAIHTYNQAFQYGFTNYQLWVNQGDAYYLVKDKGTLAKGAYRQAIQLGRDVLRERPYDVQIWANLAPVYARIGEPDSARAAIQRALSQGGDNPHFLCSAALTYWETGDTTAALEYLEGAVNAGYPITWVRDSASFDTWKSQSRYMALVDSASSAERSDPQSRGGL